MKEPISQGKSLPIQYAQLCGDVVVVKLCGGGGETPSRTYPFPTVPVARAPVHIDMPEHLASREFRQILRGIPQPHREMADIGTGFYLVHGSRKTK